jgi:hypothetical protein
MMRAIDVKSTLPAADERAAVEVDAAYALAHRIVAWDVENPPSAPTYW